MVVKDVGVKANGTFALRLALHPFTIIKVNNYRKQTAFRYLSCCNPKSPLKNIVHPEPPELCSYLL